MCIAEIEMKNSGQFVLTIPTPCLHIESISRIPVSEKKLSMRLTSMGNLGASVWYSYIDFFELIDARVPPVFYYPLAW